MDTSRILLVYYSRSGATRIAARAIQRELGCRIERIVDHTNRTGILGYLRSSFDATFHRPAALRPMNTDARDYDLVIVGTPIWNASVSAPVRAYLAANAGRIERVAFFCTHGGSGSARVLRQMEALCGQSPVATMVLRTDAVKRGDIEAEVKDFAHAIDKASVSWEAPPAQRHATLRVVPA